ncbi:MAG: class I SAM-dependent methyltransferase [Armatimonadota bacterium]
MSPLDDLTPVDDTVTRLHTETGKAWDEASVQYVRELDASIAKLQAGIPNLLEPEIGQLTRLLANGGDVLHVQCAGGTDTLSLLLVGASSVTGTDISPNMLAVAEEKAARLNLAAEWVLADTARLPESLHNCFDLVYTGRGALNWMMDINIWAKNVSACVRPGGHLFIFEGHPLDWIWDERSETLEIHPDYGGYFDADICSEAEWPTSYIDADAQPASGWSTKHERQWTLGDVVTAVAKQGMIIEILSEHPDYYWPAHPHLTGLGRTHLPHTFVLIARKPAVQ